MWQVNLASSISAFRQFVQTPQAHSYSSTAADVIATSHPTSTGEALATALLLPHLEANDFTERRVLLVCTDADLQLALRERDATEPILVREATNRYDAAIRYDCAGDAASWLVVLNIMQTDVEQLDLERWSHVVMLRRTSAGSSTYKRPLVVEALHRRLTCSRRYDWVIDPTPRRTLAAAAPPLPLTLSDPREADELRKMAEAREAAAPRTNHLEEAKQEKACRRFLALDANAGRPSAALAAAAVGTSTNGGDGLAQQVTLSHPNPRYRGFIRVRPDVLETIDPWEVKNGDCIHAVQVAHGQAAFQRHLCDVGEVVGRRGTTTAIRPPHAGAAGSSDTNTSQASAARSGLWLFTREGDAGRGFVHFDFLTSELLQTGPTEEWRRYKRVVLARLVPLDGPPISSLTDAEIRALVIAEWSQGGGGAAGTA